MKTPVSERLFKTRGFTLVEVLMGIMIFGILSTTVYGVFANAVRLNRQAQNLESLFRDAHGIIDTLSLDLENMVSYKTQLGSSFRQEVIVREATQKNVTVTQRDIFGLTEDDQLDRSFIGQEQSLSLVVAGDNGLREIAYYLEPPEQNRIYQVMVNRAQRASAAGTSWSDQQAEDWVFIVREERPFPYQDLDTAQDVQKQILGTHILKNSLLFSYAGRESIDAKEDPEWENEWIGLGQPAAIRFEMTFVFPQDGRRLAVHKEFFIPGVTAAKGTDGLVIQSK